MNICKSDDFVADTELQFEWYAKHAGWNVADRYIAAVASTCALLERQPLLGPGARLTHPRLTAWRFFVVVRPFNAHVLFYEIMGSDVVIRRTLHGHRDISRRLLEVPGSE